MEYYIVNIDRSTDGPTKEKITATEIDSDVDKISKAFSNRFYSEVARKRFELFRIRKIWDEKKN